jgi:hypothetical protein
MRCGSARKWDTGTYRAEPGQRVNRADGTSIRSATRRVNARLQAGLDAVGGPNGHDAAALTLERHVYTATTSTN